MTTCEKGTLGGTGEGEMENTEYDLERGAEPKESQTFNPLHGDGDGDRFTSRGGRPTDRDLRLRGRC